MVSIQGRTQGSEVVLSHLPQPKIVVHASSEMQPPELNKQYFNFFRIKKTKKIGDDDMQQTEIKFCKK